MLARTKASELIRDAAEKAGTLVAATLAIALTALVVAVCSLVMTLRIRHAAG